MIIRPVNKYLFLMFLFICSYSARSQCLTNSLIINTGYDPITGAAIPPGTNGGTPVIDPHWILSAVSPGVATAIAATPIAGLIEVIPGNNANVIQPIFGSWASNPVGDPGGWISCLNSNTYYDCLCGTPYNMTLGRPFRMCSDDSIKLTLYIADDNYMSATDIDGVPLLFSQPAIASTTFFSTYAFFTQTVYLTAGTHTIHFVVNNYNILAGSPSNPTGLDVYGTVSSASGSNSLVSESSAACNTYVCGGTCNALTMPDSLHLCQRETSTISPAITGTDSILNISWSPATGLSSTNILNPVVTAATSGWYYLTVNSVLPDNLIANGSFSIGNVGFTSAYSYVPSSTSALVPSGLYTITTDPALDNPFATDSFGDHTTGMGNMLAINGASTPINVWCETIPVTPNTNYDFSAWFANWSSDTTSNLPIIQFEVNGILIGTPFDFPHPDGVWTQFFTTWNSGTSTSASICINDQQTASFGNDFAIDDISFQQICTAIDSIYLKITPTDTSLTHTDTSICALAGSVTLNAPAIYSNYTWSTGATSSSVTVTGGGSYWVENEFTCSLLVDTFNITLVLPDTVFMESNAAFCLGGSVTLNAPALTGYTAAEWSTGSATSSVTVNDTGIYFVQETGACGGLSDSFNVTLYPQVTPTASFTAVGCAHSITLTALPAGAQYSYMWVGPLSFTNTLQSPYIIGATPANDGVYSVTVVDNATGCSGMAAATVTINPVPAAPLTNITPNQTIDYGSSLQLNADGALYYWWLPDDGTLSDRNINDPMATPTQNTIYTVYGMDSLGCVDSANIQVDVVADSIAIPSAFTPNGDGLNDIFRPSGMKYQSLVEFSIYNRWGQQVFTTNNKQQGWDGTFNGVKQDMGVYQYILKVEPDGGSTRLFKGTVTLIR